MPETHSAPLRHVNTHLHVFTGRTDTHRCTHGPICRCTCHIHLKTQTQTHTSSNSYQCQRHKDTSMDLPRHTETHAGTCTQNQQLLPSFLFSQVSICVNRVGSGQWALGLSVWGVSIQFLDPGLLLVNPDSSFDGILTSFLCNSWFNPRWTLSRASQVAQG